MKVAYIETDRHIHRNMNKWTNEENGKTGQTPDYRQNLADLPKNWHHFF